MPFEVSIDDPADDRQQWSIGNEANRGRQRRFESHRCELLADVDPRVIGEGEQLLEYRSQSIQRRLILLDNDEVLFDLQDEVRQSVDEHGDLFDVLLRGDVFALLFVDQIDEEDDVVELQLARVRLRHERH